MATTTLIAPAGRQNTKIQTEYGNYFVAADLTVTVDSRLVKDLLGAGYTIQDDDLAAGYKIRAGRYTAVAQDATANLVDIDTTLTTVVSFSVLIRRSNIVMGSATVTVTNGLIRVADNSSTYVLTTDDVIDWIAVGS